jgi:predicted porin
MKKLLLATLVAATAAPVLAKPYAQVDAGIYQFLSADTVSSAVPTLGNVIENKGYTAIESNASRFGFKEEYELTPTTSGIVQAEFGLEADGDTSTLKHRNIFVGLKDITFGTVKVGHQDSYVKLAQGEVDFFNDAAGEVADMKNVFKGESRLQNVIMYETPVYMGVQAKVMLQQGEQNVADNSTPPAGTEFRNSIGDGTSASINYTNEDMGIYAAIAMDNKISPGAANPAADLQDIVRVVASYKAPVGIVVNAMYNTYEPSDNNTTNKKEDGYLLGLGYKVTDEVFVKSQFQTSTASQDAQADLDKTQFGVGVDYKFSDKVKGTVMYTSLKSDSLQFNSTVKAAKTDIFGVSINTKF